MDGIGINIIIAYIVGLILLYLLGWVLLTPIKIVWRLLYNGIIGGIILVILNFVGGHFGLHIPLNPFSALIAGFLGVPGIILLLLLQYLL
ncbi:pro-sigmaK processing inhibitor BofA family protein [Calorimonas adulescens]|uniref:pro-sigmaK processing inhibitor BofA family protein n=1 Tax=Calorimonas adulescens TaxID=2606906 RepID=UPI001EF0790A|nr:pro-sigmaK processing inhibitor BofA family protein [Calorimonas adulescens]